MAEALETRLSPPATKPHTSVARLAHAWYVACESKELGKTPIARTILGAPLVLFRTESGRAAALLDRCPHRNVPLSLGEVAGENLRCRYHGWEFDPEGVCRKVPCLVGEPEGKARQASAHAIREVDGYVWIWGTAGEEPVGEPYRLPHLDDPSYMTVRQRIRMPGSMHAMIENALDVPHTAFLHSGLFRSAGEKNEIEAVVRRWPDRVEAEFIGEPRPSGLMGRLASPSGGVVTHFDRFIMPCVAQVEYRLGSENHTVTTSLCTPVNDFETEIYGAVSLRLRFPTWMLRWFVRPVLQPVAMKVLGQDAEILERQTEVIQRFGGEQFASTDVDLLGAPILRMLRQAERGETPETPPEGEEIKRIKMRV